jgi:hypothetical protein
VLILAAVGLLERRRRPSARAGAPEPVRARRRAAVPDDRPDAVQRNA